LFFYLPKVLLVFPPFLYPRIYLFRCSFTLSVPSLFDPPSPERHPRLAFRNHFAPSASVAVNKVCLGPCVSRRKVVFCYVFCNRSHCFLVFFCAPFSRVLFAAEACEIRKWWLSAAVPACLPGEALFIESDFFRIVNALNPDFVFAAPPINLSSLMWVSSVDRSSPTPEFAAFYPPIFPIHFFSPLTDIVPLTSPTGPRFDRAMLPFALPVARPFRIRGPAAVLELMARFCFLFGSFPFARFYLLGLLPLAGYADLFLGFLLCFFLPGGFGSFPEREIGCALCFCLPWSPEYVSGSLSAVLQAFSPPFMPLLYDHGGGPCPSSLDEDGFGSRTQLARPGFGNSGFSKFRFFGL